MYPGIGQNDEYAASHNPPATMAPVAMGLSYNPGNLTHPSTTSLPLAVLLQTLNCWENTLCH